MKEKLTLIKVGGAIVEDEAQLNSLLQHFTAIEGRKVLVHGGGRRATQVAAQLGIESKMVNGRRITDAEMLQVVTMVYGGLVNKNLVAKLQAQGVNALGLTGADMDVLRSHRRPIKNGVDYGFVGTFAVILLSLSLMNYRMKHVNLQAQDNFYDAEKVLDEIRAGLAVDVADAAGAAYQETLEKYSTLSVDDRKKHYAKTFSTRMLSSSLASSTNAGQWNPDYLRSLVSAETKAGTKDGNGLTIE